MNTAEIMALLTAEMGYYSKIDDNLLEAIATIVNTAYRAGRDIGRKRGITEGLNEAIKIINYYH